MLLINTIILTMHPEICILLARNEYYEREKSQYSEEENYGSEYLFMHKTQVW